MVRFFQYQHCADTQGVVEYVLSECDQSSSIAIIVSLKLIPAVGRHACSMGHSSPEVVFPARARVRVVLATLYP